MRVGRLIDFQISKSSVLCSLFFSQGFSSHFRSMQLARRAHQSLASRSRVARKSACDSGRLGWTRCCVDRCSELVELASRSFHHRPATRCCVDRCSKLVELANRSRIARKSVARRLQNRPPSALQSSLWRPKNRRPEGLKSTLGGSKIEPRSPRTLRGSPRASQERPKSVPRRLKNAPRASQSALRPPKSGPRAAQERPGGSQDASQGAPGGPRGPF